MGISKIVFQRFTAFKELVINCSGGINIFVGPNGTGKTHILKAAYSACDISKSGEPFAKKLVNVFMPFGKRLNRLVYQHKETLNAALEITRGNHTLRLSFSGRAKNYEASSVKGLEQWLANPVESVYLPVKEMLVNAPGFRSLYNARELHFEEVYADLVDRAYLPPRRDEADSKRKKLMKTIEKVIEGRVITKDEEFFLSSEQGTLEFSLLAEGMRKLALLWILIRNGTLLDGSIMFWDEPETNLNPAVMKTAVEILLELQRMGVQVFIATHDYVLLKEFDLQAKKKDRLLYHGLSRRTDARDIAVQSTDSYCQLSPNAISDTFQETIGYRCVSGLWNELEKTQAK
jgi:energy-coupling factor transporter ATP-binding protein EcfA2